MGNRTERPGSRVEPTGRRAAKPPGPGGRSDPGRHPTDRRVGRAPVRANPPPAAFAPPGSDHRHPRGGRAAPIELPSGRGRPAATKGYLPGQNAAHYRSPGMERCPSHPGLSEPVCDRGDFSRDERSAYRGVVAPAPLDGQQNSSPRTVLHDCRTAPGAPVATSTPSGFAIIHERLVAETEPAPPSH